MLLKNVFVKIRVLDFACNLLFYIFCIDDDLNLRRVAAAGIEVARVALLNSGFTYQGFASLAGLFNWKAVILAVVLFLATNYKKLKKVHPVVFIAASAVIGVVFRFAGAA